MDLYDVMFPKESYGEMLKNDVKQYIEFYNTKRVTLKMGLRITS